jgi:hypothetical protein
MIRFVVVELLFFALIALFARNLWAAKNTGKIMYSGTNLASRTKHPKTFWSIVLFNALMLIFLGLSAVEFALR